MLKLRLLCVLVCVGWGWAAMDYTVLPTAATQCPGAGNCKTLLQYLRESDVYFTSNTVFTFLPGQYELDVMMTISDVDDLTLRSEGKATIECTKGVGLTFMNISLLKIEGLALSNCGRRIPPADFVSNISLYGTTFLNISVPVGAGLFLNYIENLELTDVEVIGSDGYGVLAVNILGAVIERSVFRDNNNETLYLSECYQGASLDCKGGNFILIYTDLHDCPAESLSYSLTITDSEFVGGVDPGLTYHQFLIVPPVRNDLYFLGGAGLGLILMQSSYGVEVLIDNCTIEYNTAQAGANFYVSVYDFVDNSSITIQDSQLQYANAKAEILESEGIYLIGAGLFYIYGTVPLSRYVPICSTAEKHQIEVLSISNTDVSFNRATLNVGIFLVMWAKTFLSFTREIRLTDVRMTKNYGDATIISMNINDVTDTHSFQTYVTNCTFSENRYREGNTGTVIASNNPTVYYALSVSHIEFQGCIWSHNLAPAIRSSKSIVSFLGTNQFINNSATDGAALTLQEGSVIHLGPDSVTVFRDNAASDFGGAIFANMFTYTCFYQIDSLEDMPPLLIFDGNSAGQAGDAVYANLDVCVTETGTTSADSIPILLKISRFEGNDSASNSLIAATPNRLCHCVDGVVSSTCMYNNTININTFPGRVFNVSAEAQSFSGGGLAPSFVTARVLGDSAEVHTTGAEEKLNKGCSVIPYRLFGPPDQSVSIQIIPASNRIYYPIFINVTLLSCPSGFAYSEDTMTCGCASFIMAASTVCDIDTETFTIDSSRWLGYVNFAGSMEVGYGDCREDLECNTEGSIKTVSLAEQDAQCTNDHAGVLCGECLPGYSITLGSENCRECSNAYLALIIVFAAAGVLLLVLLSACNVTIATGRINSMLFYANVLRLANFDFFAIQNPAFALFQTIINWVNFDFSIKTCFYDGLTSYVKAWLQFVFPAYLFTLLIVVVLAIQKSSRLAKAAPHNFLAVFTTVILMCYSKLLRASVQVFPASDITTDNATYTVWLVDGSIPYFSAKHAILLVFSILVWLLWILPYTFVMVVYPFLSTFTAHEDTIFECIVCFFRRQLFRFRPILETHDGPFEPNCRYWNGLLIVMRLLIFFFALGFYTSGGDSGDQFKLAVVTVVSLVLLGIIVAQRVYRCHVNRKVEFINLLNLAILEFVLLVISLTSGDSNLAQGIAISISVVVACITFIVSMAYENYYYYQSKYYACRGLEDKLTEKDKRCQAMNLEREKKYNERVSWNNDGDVQFLGVIDERSAIKNTGMTTRSSISIPTSLDRLQEDLLEHERPATN